MRHLIKPSSRGNTFPTNQAPPCSLASAELEPWSLRLFYCGGCQPSKHQRDPSRNAGGTPLSPLRPFGRSDGGLCFLPHAAGAIPFPRLWACPETAGDEPRTVPQASERRPLVMSGHLQRLSPCISQGLPQPWRRWPQARSLQGPRAAFLQPTLRGSAGKACGSWWTPSCTSNVPLGQRKLLVSRAA